MNTGVQRSSATPPAARTATTMAVGAQPGAEFGQGKNLPLIAMAHEIPYVATATVADLRDLEAKVDKAMGMHGARYLHILVPCPLGWGAASHDTIRLARLARETGIFPVFEAEHGEVTAVTKIRHRVPVEDYLKPQKRFAHLFGTPGQPRDAGADPGRRRPQHPPLQPARRRRRALTWTSPSRSRSTPARRWPTRPAAGAPSARSTSTGCRRATPSARRARTSRAGCSTPRAATTRPPGATWCATTPSPRSWGGSATTPAKARATAARSTPPVGINSVERFLGDEALQARLALRSAGAGNRQARAGRRRRPVGHARGLPPAPPGPPRHGDGGRPAAGRHDAIRHPAVPAAARRARRRDAAHRRHGRDGAAQRQGQPHRRARCAASTRPSWRWARTSASAPTSRPRIRRASSTRSRCCAAWKARTSRCWAVAWSSTAAATPRSTWRAPPSAWAPPRPSSSTAAPANACRRTTSRSRRRCRKA